MGHSKWSLSASARWTRCPASIRLSVGIPNTSSQAAETGTGAHELGEFCCRYGVEPEQCIDMEFNGVVVDSTMAEHIKLYTGFIASLSVQTGCDALLEQRVTMSSLGRSDVYGTADHTLIDLANRTLYISDLKYGYEPVEVEENRQLIAYAICALDTFDLWYKVDKVVTTIIQPRKPHIDGPIRSATYTVFDLREWQPVYAEAVRLSEQPNTKPVAGSHCKYCPFRARCRARLEDLMSVMFPDSSEEELSNGEIGLIYERIPEIKRFIDAVADQALENARKGKEPPPGYKLVKGIQRASVENESELIKECEEQGLDTSNLYEKKLKSKTAVKKLLPSNIVNKHWVVPPAKSTLALMSDNRPSINTRSAKGMFTPVGPGPSAKGMFEPIKN